MAHESNNSTSPTETSGLAPSTCQIIELVAQCIKTGSGGVLTVAASMDDEQANFLEYVNIFDYNPKYGVRGARIFGVTYWPQRFNKFMQLLSYTLPALAKGGRNNG